MAFALIPPSSGATQWQMATDDVDVTMTCQIITAVL